ncbi:MAG: HindVP family restriction endonuclease [Betaproteobacteria bacterium]|nr:MAG: HindVP family restriction endonuclease [Betaproteobacteria bacterium]
MIRHSQLIGDGVLAAAHKRERHPFGSTRISIVGVVKQQSEERLTVVGLELRGRATFFGLTAICARTPATHFFVPNRDERMNAAVEVPGLFGISKSNRDFSDPYYWGKNQFNSSFPLALLCYMGTKGLDPVYIRFGSTTKPHITSITTSNVFGSGKDTHELHFAFEHRFQPFESLLQDTLKPIDLVVCDGDIGVPLRPLEVKLTTLPDGTTDQLDSSKYGAELVIRSATTRYMALSMGETVLAHRTDVKTLFQPVLGKIRNWDSAAEMKPKAAKIVSALESFLAQHADTEVPLLLQPIWKTIGRSSQLDEHCLDVFVWSNFAIAHLFLGAAKSCAADGTDKISRPLRTALRLARFLSEVSERDKVYQDPIFDGMNYDHQNDKEFAIAGTKTNALMSCPELTQPRITKHEIKNVILGGGQKWLSPERRFDAIIYFSHDLFATEHS